MSTSSPQLSYHHSGRRPRRGSVLAATLAATVVGLATVVAASPAHADGGLLGDGAHWRYRFDRPGTYSLTVPQRAVGFEATLTGASGGDGGDSAYAHGGKGEGGTGIDFVMGVGGGNPLHPGETIVIVVGKRGAGGAGGSGSLAAGSGGAGGGASAVIEDTGALLTVAAGGAGGGGAGGLLGGADGGGRGGTAAGDGAWGGHGGAPGDDGENLTCGPHNVTRYFGAGLPGEDAASSSSAGGGGGGGGGACGGGGGKAGSLGGGGGAGGAGGSIRDPNWVGGPTGPTNPGSDGSVLMDITLDTTESGAYFTSGDTASISSDQGTFSHQVMTEAAPDAAVSYALSGAPDWLSIDPATGMLRGQGFRAAGAHGTYAFDINATATGGENPQRTTTQHFTLTVAQAPAFGSAPRLSTPFGTPFTADLSTNGFPAPTYSLLGTPPSWVSIDPDTGVLTGKAPAGSQGSYSLFVMARNGVDPLVSEQVQLTVTVPELTITTEPHLPSGVSGRPYSNTLHASGGDGALTWTLVSGSLPEGITLSPEGVLSGTNIAKPGDVVSSFVVSVTDSESTPQSASVHLSLAVEPPALQATGPASLHAVVGTPYSSTLTASGGFQPYRWAVGEGSRLPDGLSLSSEGVVSGTPTAPGTSTTTFTVSDLLDSTTVDVTFDVAPRLACSVPAMLSGTRGVRYSRQLTATGGTGTPHWAVAGGSRLPSGLTLSGSGVLSGTPTTAGVSGVNLVVTDSGTPPQGTSCATAFSVGVPPLRFTGATTLRPKLRATYSHALTASGGTGAYHWALQPGSTLPAGLRLSSTGVVSGRPTSRGTRTVVVAVTDSARPVHQVTSRVTITVS